MVRFALFFTTAMLAGAQALPPIEQLVDQAISATAEQAALLPEFTFDLESIIQEFDKNGKPKKLTTTTGETYMSALRNLDIALRTDGKPLPAKDIEKSRSQAIKQIEADYSARQKLAASGRPVRDFGNQMGDIRMEPLFILKNCPIANLRITSAQGRRAYALDFSPCTIRLKEPHQHLSGVRGTLWIDQETHVIVEARSWLADDSVDAKPWYESTSQWFSGPEPAWIPQRVHFNLSASPKLFGMRMNVDWKVSNPRRFVVTMNEAVKY